MGYYEILSPDKKKSYGKHACINVGFNLTSESAAEFSKSLDQQLDQIMSPLERIDLMHKAFESSESVKGKMTEFFPRRTSFWSFNSSMEGYIENDFDPESIMDPMLTNQLYGLINKAAPGLVSSYFIKRIEESMRKSPEVTRMWATEKGGIQEYFHRFPGTLKDLSKDENKLEYLIKLVDFDRDKVLNKIEKAVPDIPRDLIDLIRDNVGKKVYFYEKDYEGGIYCGTESIIPLFITEKDFLEIAENYVAFNEEYSTDFDNLIDDLYYESTRNDAGDYIDTLDENYTMEDFKRDYGKEFIIDNKLIKEYENIKDHNEDVIQINRYDARNKRTDIQKNLEGKKIVVIEPNDEFVVRTTRKGLAESQWDRAKDLDCAGSNKEEEWLEKLDKYVKGEGEEEEGLQH